MLDNMCGVNNVNSSQNVSSPQVIVSKRVCAVRGEKNYEKNGNRRKFIVWKICIS